MGSLGTRWSKSTRSRPAATRLAGWSFDVAAMVQTTAMDLNGKRVVVTGGSRGIGEAIARDLADRGASLALVARSVNLLETVAASLPNAVAVPVDLGDRAAVDGLIARCEAALGGPIDVLVNNAGIDEVGIFADTTAEDIVRIHQINLLTPIELCRQALVGMNARRSGHIVNVSSMAGSGGFTGMSLYCSTKAGLSNFSGILRRELPRNGRRHHHGRARPDSHRHARPRQRVPAHRAVVHSPSPNAAPPQRPAPSVSRRRSELPSRTTVNSCAFRREPWCSPWRGRSPSGRSTSSSAASTDAHRDGYEASGDRCGPLQRNRAADHRIVRPTRNAAKPVALLVRAGSVVSSGRRSVAPI